MYWPVARGLANLEGLSINQILLRFHAQEEFKLHSKIISNARASFRYRALPILAFKAFRGRFAREDS